MTLLDSIQTELRENQLTNNPSLCAEYIGRLSGELSYYLARQIEIEITRSKNWLELRKDYKSDTQAQNAFLNTEQGRDWQSWESDIKRTKALLVGLKAIIKNCEAESYNQH